ncbi:MAG: hypothetical protein JWO90_2862 [Solirubrobacterales bacterium]|jgi:hypothetical protein|nr:hypothetical protein [Solirubrobacterales bacterium]
MRARMVSVLVPAGLLAVLLALFLGARKLLAGSRTINGAVLHTPTDDTGLDPQTGAVRSVQGADIILPEEALQGYWNPEHLERLARTYWKSLTRFTLGICRVGYSEEERWVYAFHPAIRLLTMQKPEYEMSSGRGIVRWRIEKGLLVAANGRGGDGYLEIDVCRFDYPDWNKARIHVEIEVANFYPQIASKLGTWLYVNTQSRIHVIACHFFLRQLVKRDLDVSKVQHFSGPLTAEETPDPVPAREKDAGALGARPEAGSVA